MDDEKQVARADRAAALREPAVEAASRRWWRLLPRLLTAPATVFRALREDDEDDVAARQEPLLAIVLLAGMGGAVLTPTWGRLLDDGSIDGIVAVVLTFIGGSAAGVVVYVLVSLALWIGIRGAGSLEPARRARQVAGFSALPIALSLFVTVPVALIAFGGDFFRSGGSDEDVGRAIVVALGLAFVAWSLVLLAIGLRTAMRLPWRGVAVALGLAAVAVAVVAALPYVL
ncbi:MAG: YIP1 family protein [Actinobacteria bacterium]|nr:YIP1 family protein [Actinomycetota bacterium]